MKKILSIILSVVLMFSITACSTDDKWQKKYDRGIRYLSELDYENAIIAFNAAIEIDPKNSNAYIGLADVYAMQEDYETAISILKDAMTQTNDDISVSDRLVYMEEKLENSFQILKYVWDYELNISKSEDTYRDGRIYRRLEWDSEKSITRYTYYKNDGSPKSYEILGAMDGNGVHMIGVHLEYDSSGQLDISILDLGAEKTISKYDGNGNVTDTSTVFADGFTYNDQEDDNGKIVEFVFSDSQGNHVPAIKDYNLVK